MHIKKKLKVLLVNSNKLELDFSSIHNISVKNEHTDTGCNGRSALLVAFGAPIARDSCHPILAGTLSSCLVAGPARRSHRMAVTSCEMGKRGEVAVSGE